MSDLTILSQRIPKYIAIRDAIAHQIESGQLTQQMKLPSERLLSEQFSTTRVAVREALLALEMDGLIYRLDRRGWFVRAPRIIYHLQSTKSFNQYVQEQGGIPATELISAESVAATEWDAAHLHIDVGDEVYSIWRRRSINGRPAVVEHLRINAKLFPHFLTQNLQDSITLLMATKYQRQLTRAHINLYPTAFSEQQAKALHVNVGSMGLYICRTNRDQNGMITDVDQEYWLHDVLDLHFEAQNNTIS
ncbi:MULTISPECIES: UTRA domain-containing protein [unclassified Acinetobacter]|uniref:UTRA domain-containing protein n=1 Tax=unclassified Acinetobacter TaxID=196816 RepID=UPI0029352D95|nr:MULTISPECIES: UTRA domain-containing protein [unclassified Acinetobacter]WOE33328.1 UTRA domain-containing protein [Acinetobacter sp. SAAs470]WOE37013.1 UTRA domain-containing protein [Acinetobacter sp. SAAs474]